VTVAASISVPDNTALSNPDNGQDIVLTSGLHGVGLQVRIELPGPGDRVSQGNRQTLRGVRVEFRRGVGPPPKNGGGGACPSAAPINLAFGSGELRPHKPVSPRTSGVRPERASRSRGPWGSRPPTAKACSREVDRPSDIAFELGFRGGTGLFAPDSNQATHAHTWSKTTGYGS
jgi:hypothetical protein